MDAAPFAPKYRAQSSRLALVRMGLRRERRPDDGLGSEGRVRRDGYFGVKIIPELTIEHSLSDVLV